MSRNEHTEISGSFELLNNRYETIKPIDVRIFTRSCVENTGDFESDLARYIDLLPNEKRSILDAD